MVQLYQASTTPTVMFFFYLLLQFENTRAETRFRLPAQQTSPFKSAGASVKSSTGSRGVRISGSNAGYTMFRGSVKSTGYPFHSPDSPSLPLPFVTVCHHISAGVYHVKCLRYSYTKPAQRPDMICYYLLLYSANIDNILNVHS